MFIYLQVVDWKKRIEAFLGIVPLSDRGRWKPVFGKNKGKKINKKAHVLSLPGVTQHYVP